MNNILSRCTIIAIITLSFITLTACSPNNEISPSTVTPTKERTTVYDKIPSSRTIQPTPTPDIQRNLQGDTIPDIIHPMDHWIQEEYEENNGKFKMIFHDDNPEVSIENFDDYINNIAGFDVYTAAFDSNINVHACRVPEDLGDVDNCFALFRTKVNNTWYDITVELGYYDQGKTPRPVEIYAYPRKGYDYSARNNNDWEF